MIIMYIKIAVFNFLVYYRSTKIIYNKLKNILTFLIDYQSVIVNKIDFCQSIIIDFYQ
jgi:hypothetical protein